MKLSIAFLALGFAGQVHGHGLRMLEECPVPGTGAACPSDMQKVMCNNCEYDNACLANQAGFTANVCQPVTPDCPVPGTGITCTADVQVVMCNGCQYDNPCLANAAGFAETTQCTTPPKPCNPTTSADCPQTPPPPQVDPTPPPCNPTTTANCPEKPVPELMNNAETAAPTSSAVTTVGLAGSLAAVAMAIFMA